MEPRYIEFRLTAKEARMFRDAIAYCLEGKRPKKVWKKHRKMEKKASDVLRHLRLSTGIFEPYD